MPRLSTLRPRRIWDRLAPWPLLLLAMFAALMIYRVVLIESNFAVYVGCPDCFRWPSLSADAVLLAALTAILLAMVNLPWRAPRVVLGLACSALLVIYIADLFILNLFGIRLFFIDLAMYGLEPAIIWDQFSGRFGGPVPALLLAAGIFVACLLPAVLPCRRRPWLNLVLAGILGLALLLVVLPARPDYVHNWIFKNVLVANLSSSESAHYSDTEAERRLTRYQAAFPHRCVQAPPDRRNVVLLIIESWSSYHSQAFGGHLSWTPELDTLARANTRYTRFHAGGFSTNEGLVNLLGGVRLWAPFSHLFEAAEFGHAWGIHPSLPQVFNEHGFQTALLTTGPLTFLRKGEWFGDLGFDHVEGNEHPFYRHWPRIAFHAAADQALYRRALDWLDHEADEPFLLVLETVSTHQPYIDPETGERDMQAVFNYADRWAAHFHAELQARGFFDDGVLLITSDHRSMDPIRPEEHERFGLAAPSRIPLILIDAQRPGGEVVEAIFQLGDLLPSFEHRLRGEVCMDAFQASLFEQPPHTAHCAFHLRGSMRGVVDILCAEGEGQVRLEGDHTRFLWHEGLDPARREAILDTIAKDRLDGLRRHRAHQQGDESP